MTTVYMNTVLEEVATVPGYAAKQAEDRKFLADRTSTKPISTIQGDPHILIPFAVEDGGRLGGHAQALLRALASSSLSKGRNPPLRKGGGGDDLPHARLTMGQEVAATHLGMVALGDL